MLTRIALVVGALPLFAQAGCTQQDYVSLATVAIQSLVGTVIPLLVNSLVGTGVGV